MSKSLTNFGGNVIFTPRHCYVPHSEEEVLEILNRHADGKIRVIGALHSWSPAVQCDDVIVDMRRFDNVQVDRTSDGESWAAVGGGCQIKHLLQKLHAVGEVTIPSLGLITEQTIAGAIATATHGSGRHSLSHYIAELRVAAYDDTGKACIYTWSDGPELRAARCALGCMGIVLAVRFRCVPKYDVAETIEPCTTIDAAVAREDEFPLQQFSVPPLGLLTAARRHPVSSKRSFPPSLPPVVAPHADIIAWPRLLHRSRVAWRFFYRRVVG